MWVAWGITRELGAGVWAEGAVGDVEAHRQAEARATFPEWGSMTVGEERQAMCVRRGSGDNSAEAIASHSLDLRHGLLDAPERDDQHWNESAGIVRRPFVLVVVVDLQVCGRQVGVNQGKGTCPVLARRGWGIAQRHENSIAIHDCNSFAPLIVGARRVCQPWWQACRFQSRQSDGVRTRASPRPYR